jgi:alpha-beta hydrolase superfamily lysophospholipase
MRVSFVCGLAFVVSLVACAEPREVTTSNVSALTDEREPSEMARLPDDVIDLLRHRDDLTDTQLDAIHRVGHDIDVAPGRRIHVIETFTLRAFFRWPHRAALMIPGPVTNATFWNIDVPGYDGGRMLAERGFFAWAADLEGAGASSMPADGRVATLERQVENLRVVLEHMRAMRFVTRADVLGESWGGSIAAELCDDPAATRACVMSSMIYKNASDIGNATFRSPEFHALLDSLPNGYLPTFPDFYLQFVDASTAEVQAFTFATQPGLYSVAPEYAVFDLPFFDPTRARVPGIVIRGENDPNQPLSDTQELARDYGTHGARLVVLAGAGHVPRLAAPPVNETFWTTVLDFVDHGSRSTGSEGEGE